MSDVKINLKNAHVIIPIFNSANFSLKNRLLNVFNKNYDNTVYVSALKNINLSINQGEKVGLVGTNGSGKSTLLRLICQIYKPSTGSADINGKINSLIDINTGLDGEASGWNNIILRLTLFGLTKIQIQKKINEIVDFSELGKVIHQPFYSYSSGMKLRLAFATITAVKSEILIMDEWLSVGDKNFLIKSNERLKQLTKNASIFILASHDKDLLTKNCNRIIWLKEGQIFKDDVAEKIIDEYFLNYNKS
jgi:lipopolysaccharide transport system ATP-binding protein